MPHASIKLKPGIDQNETPALNEAGISFSNLVRFIPDRNGLGLIQKLGGWLKYYSGNISIPAIIRALWAWEDTNANKHLAFGTQNSISTGTATLGVINDPASSYADITPRTSVTNSITPQASSTSGSALIQITDTFVGEIDQYDSVYIATHISIGGVVLFGVYQCNPTYTIPDPTKYYVLARDVLGNLIGATSTSTSASVAFFQTTANQTQVNVTLNSHGYSVGSTYPVLVSTLIGGITFYGNYIVEAVIDANNFIINGNTIGDGSSGYINGGNVYFIYIYGTGQILPYTYGSGPYGGGLYSYGSSVPPATGTEISATDWTMDNWGQILISCPISPNASGTPQFQPIYQYDPTSTNSYASIIDNAPPINDGIFVAMPQRQIIAWGSTATGVQDPLLVNWCDVNNYNTWIPTITNQAGSYRLPKGSKIVGAIQGPQQGLIWTDIDVWSMQYIGPPYVYSFNEIGTGCGLISRKAAASINGVVYWMGPSQFFSLTGNGVQPVPCPAWDVIFQDLDQGNLQKIRVAVNSRFGEITWFYPTISDGGEINAYVKYNVFLNAWDFGALSRTAWVDQSVLGPPIGAEPAGLQLYQHETSPNATNTDGTATAMLSSFQTGWFALSEADVKMFIDEVWPDMKWGYFGGTPTVTGDPPLNATVQITFYVTDFPSTSATQANFIGTISGSTLTVNSVYTGVLKIGQYISGANIAPNTQITGGSGTSWTVSVSQTVSTATNLISSSAQIAVYGPYSVTTATNWFNPRIRGRLVSIGLSSNDLDSFWRIGNIRYRVQQDGKY